jgi:uncharacterized repeat protein (TIGR03803 family)
MKMGIRMVPASGKTCRLIAVVLLIAAGQVGGASGQIYTNLYSFNGPNGGIPSAALIQGSDGNFYGTTCQGGRNDYGTVFRITSSGNITNLYFFGSSPNDGDDAQGGLVQGSDGNFYGTTLYGGTNDDGTIFRISSDGTFTNLYFFVGPPNDGANPQAALVQGSDGNFYGMTSSGGTNDNGTIFRISSGGNYTNLYSFVAGPNGALPQSGLVQGSDGNLYGTTAYGGTYGGGTIFRISPSGNYTNLYSFVGYPTTDGGQPWGGLVQGSDGNLYGTTYYGGTGTNCTYGCGTVFRIKPGGKYASLYSFVGSPHDGASPFAGLLQGSDGNFYGTTVLGGTNINNGTVFKLSVPLNPPANQISEIRLSGTNIIFNIPSVACETYQLQFSSSMSPTNWVNVPGVSVTNSIGALMTVTNLGGALQPQGFYRFDITP